MSIVDFDDSYTMGVFGEKGDSVMRKSASKSVKEHRPLRTIGIIARKTFTPPLPRGKRKYKSKK
jgi:hypothetical protein